MKAAFLVETGGGKKVVLELRGRDAWALSELVMAGASGCTPITHPGPRWSGYVYRLKRKHGLSVETVHETHKGPFPGTHARYVLKTRVLPVDSHEAAT